VLELGSGPGEGGLEVNHKESVGSGAGGGEVRAAAGAAQPGDQFNQAHPEPATPPRSGRRRRKELSPPQLRAIQLLATGKSMVAAAEEVGVSSRTISRWVREDAFAAEYRSHMSELQLELWNQMLAVRSEAWGRFLELLHSSDESIALRASFWVLDRMLKVPAIMTQLAMQESEAAPDTSPRLRAFLDSSEAPALVPCDEDGTG